MSLFVAPPKADRFILVITYFFIFLLIISLSSCQKFDVSKLDKPLAEYYDFKFAEALISLDKLAAESNDNPLVLTWMAQTNYRLGNKGEALRIAELALENNPNSSFANTVAANASIPTPENYNLQTTAKSWEHLQRAVELDPLNGNAWIRIWGLAILRNDKPTFEKSIRMIAESGFVTDAARAYARWMLRTLPENAILITNGDMDTFPALAVQLLENFRTDISIIEWGLLDYDWAIKYLRDHTSLPLSFTNNSIDTMTHSLDATGNLIPVSSQIFRSWINDIQNGMLDRSLVIATTVDPAFYQIINNQLQFIGNGWLFVPGSSLEKIDFSLAAQTFDLLDLANFNGPWASKMDTSPVRARNKNIVKNITYSALNYIEELIKIKKYTDAEKMIMWARNFEKSTELGSCLESEILRFETTLKESR